MLKMVGMDQLFREQERLRENILENLKYQKTMILLCSMKHLEKMVLQIKKDGLKYLLNDCNINLLVLLKLHDKVAMSYDLCSL